MGLGLVSAITWYGALVDAQARIGWEEHGSLSLQRLRPLQRGTLKGFPP